MPFLYFFLHTPFRLKNINIQKTRTHTSQKEIEIVKNIKFDWQALIEIANVAILIFNDSGRICYANLMVKAITGYTKAELLRNTDLLSQLRLLQQANCAKDSSKAASNHEISLLTKNGNRCWLNCSIQKIEYDRQPATLITAFNITAYKQAQEQIQQDLEREKMRSYNSIEFASIVSHELRTPLNIISFSCNLLRQYYNRWDIDKKQEHLNRIQRGIQTVSLLINEVSIMARAEAQTTKFAPQKLELHKFCKTLQEDLQLVNCSEQQINFSIKGDRFVFLDKNILQLILTNLLENAIKYSPPGQAVDFTVTVNFSWVIFKIQDRGIGIAKSDLQRLFEPFYRGSNVGELPGNGLGLAVVKKLVNLHGGEINVNSQIGVGTEFIVSLPKQK